MLYYKTDITLKYHDTTHKYRAKSACSYLRKVNILPCLPCLPPPPPPSQCSITHAAKLVVEKSTDEFTAQGAAEFSGEVARGGKNRQHIIRR